MKVLYWINRKLPFSFLPIARIRLGRQTATLRKDGWVIISDGKSTDALPINFCAPAVIEAFNAEFA
ncbi:hypothetical protein OKW98_18730 [Pseudomonas sp. KU26590]|uniref:hypothetical protein n=1 Tax=Pseudomonas sp. KU26590 TaxID=2991051 RepID=UPI00223D96A3|nr:hypothetical protein [Pseudomonas sp. KU26590]UZJ58614.1 hypothetical protein OKW98_18730 [Pseudomonas sp. KU26590]